MSDEDLLLFGLEAMSEDDLPVFIRHLQAVHHHQRADVDIHLAASELQHLVDMRVLEEELAVKLVVLFVECPAGDEYSNPHTSSIVAD